MGWGERSLVLSREAAEDSPSDHVAGSVDDSEGHHARAARAVRCDLRVGVASKITAHAPALVGALVLGDEAGCPVVVLLLVDVELVVHQRLVTVLEDR